MGRGAGQRYLLGSPSSSGGGEGGEGGGGTAAASAPSSPRDDVTSSSFASSSSSSLSSSIAKPLPQLSSTGELKEGGKEGLLQRQQQHHQQMPRRWSDGFSRSGRMGGGDGGGGEEGDEEEEEEEEEDMYEDDDDESLGGGRGGSGGGRPLSSEKWQIRGGIRGVAGGNHGGGKRGKEGGKEGGMGGFSSFTTGAGGGFNALKFLSSSGGLGGGREGGIGPLSGRSSFMYGGMGGGWKARGGSVAWEERGGGGGGEEEGEGTSGSSDKEKEGSVLSPNVAASSEEQEAVIAQMMRLTRRLPPRPSLDIHGFPTLHFLRPLRLPSDLIPLLHKSTTPPPSLPSSSSSTLPPSAFIYNPFTERGRGGGRGVTWAAGEVAHVALSLSNPLAAPLNIQSIELLVEEGGKEGGREGMPGRTTAVAFCYPVTLWIPAWRQQHPLTLSLKPLQPGPLLIKGVKITVFNITSLVLVDKEGNGPPPLPRPAPRDWYPRQAQPYLRRPKGEEAKEAAAAHEQQQQQQFLSTAGGREGGRVAAAAVPANAVPTNHTSVVPALPWLTTKLDRWATNIELFPGEYRRASIELQGRLKAASARNLLLPLLLQRINKKTKLTNKNHTHSLPPSLPPSTPTVMNEVPLGYLEVSVHQKALTKKAKAAGRPVVLYTFLGGAEGGREGGREGIRGGGGGGEESLSVALDPLGLDALTQTLQTALATHSCLSSLSLPLLFRRVDRFPEADIFIKYSSSSSCSTSSSLPSSSSTHRHFRTLTIPLRFHLKEGLSTTDLAVETAAIHIYPALARAIEAVHRGAWEESSSPVRRRFKGGGGREGGMMMMDVIDTDGEECFLLVEVRNLAGEDLHVKACLVEGEEGGEDGKEEGKEDASGSPMRKFRLKQQSPIPPPHSPPPPPPPLPLPLPPSLASTHQALSSEVTLLQSSSLTPTALIIRPHATRRVIIPFPRLPSHSPLLSPPPPPLPPPGGGRALPPTITLDSPMWTRALHGLCRSLKLQWSDRYGGRGGLLRLSPTLASAVKPLALERLRLPALKLSCQVGGEEGGEEGMTSPPRPKKVTASSSFTVLQPVPFPHASPRKTPHPPSPPRSSSSFFPPSPVPPAPTAAPALHPFSSNSSNNITTSPPYTSIPIHFRVTNRSLTQPLPPCKCFAHTYQDYGKVRPSPSSFPLPFVHRSPQVTHFLLLASFPPSSSTGQPQFCH